MLKGVYGWINPHAVRSWTLANMRAQAEYRANPFSRKEHSQPLPKRINYRWTAADVRYLVRKRKQGTPYYEIALHLKRTKSAVQAKAEKLGITNKRS